MRTLLRRSFAALFVVGALALFVTPFAGAQTVCTRTGSKVTIPAADTSITCNLKAGAVTYKVTVTPAPPRIVTPPKDTIRPAPIPVPVPAPVDTTKPPSSTSADILNNASFESGWDGFADWSFGATPQGLTRDCTTAADGACSLRHTWTPNPGADAGSKTASSLGAQADRVWVRFSIKITAPITTIMKFVRFYDSRSFNTNFGGLFLGSGNDILTFGTDQENSAITTTIGVTQAQLVDGKWHTIEMEYWRNGDPSGYPTTAFWLDGKSVSATSTKWFGSGNKAFWSNGRLNIGERKSSGKLGVIEWIGTLNKGNTTTGQVNIDRVSISTKGRIGQ